MAWIAAAAMALYGAYQGKRSADKQERAQNEAIQYAKDARQAASRELGGKKIWSAGEHYFPGLIAPPTSLIESKNVLNKAGEEAMKHVATAKNPKKLKYWQHQVKKTQRQADKTERELNPWDYLQQNNMAGSVAAAPAPPQGVPLSGPQQSTTAPLHGGVDPTALPEENGVNLGFGSNTSGVPTAGAAGVPTDTTTPPPTPSSGGAAPPPASGGSGQTDQTYVDNGGGGGRRSARRAKREARRERKMDKLHANDPTYQNTTNDARAGQVYPGQLVMQHLNDLLTNPGRLESTTYERAQEQSNQALNAATAAGTARVMGAGVDPRSGIGQVTQENALLNFGRQRNEAARDYSIAQEDLRRRDIQQGMEDYTNFLSLIFGLQGKRSNAKAGGPNEAYNFNTQAGAGNAAIAQGASQIGNALGGINTYGAPGTPGSTDASSTTDTGSVANRMS